MRIVYGTKLRAKICDGTAVFLVRLRLSVEISIISAYSRKKSGKNFAVSNFGYYICDATININKPCSEEGYLQVFCKLGFRTCSELTSVYFFFL